MKEFVVKRSSWHYKLYEFVFGVESWTTNLCSYFWSVVIIILLLLLIGFVVITLSFILISPFLWGLAVYLYGMFDVPGEVYVGLTVWTFAFIVFSGIFVTQLLEKQKSYSGSTYYRLKSKFDDSLIVTRYRCFKNKYCIGVRFDD